MKNLIYKISAVVMLLVFAVTTNFAQLAVCPGMDIVFYSDDINNNPADEAAIIHVPATTATYAWSMVYPDATDAAVLITDIALNDATPDIAGNNIVSLSFPIGTQVGTYTLTVVKTVTDGCIGDEITYTIEVLDMAVETVENASDTDAGNSVSNEAWCPGDPAKTFSLSLLWNDDGDNGTTPMVALTNINQIDYTTSPNASPTGSIPASGTLALGAGTGSLVVTPVYTNANDATNANDFPISADPDDIYEITITNLQFDVNNGTTITFNNVTCTEESISNMISGSTGNHAFEATFHHAVADITINHL